MFENIGGIKTDGPGFKRIIIHPQPGGKLTWANTSYRFYSGVDRIQLGQLRIGRFRLDVSSPPQHDRLHVFIPGRDTEQILESGDVAQNARRHYITQARGQL